MSWLVVSKLGVLRNHGGRAVSGSSAATWHEPSSPENTTQMPRRFTGKLCRFLFEHLERGTFGEQLLWLDRRSGVFQLLWKHGNGGSTVPHRDCAVFMWNHHRVAWEPSDKLDRCNETSDEGASPRPLLCHHVIAESL
ncbi:uncharacterized protein [Dermacentor albipictus]|uniref:uncharacterized protein isoform X8 n=1 Tax=Dermacentor albipictus TaxID=60249 RepID=UPI0038FCE9E4